MAYFRTGEGVKLFYEYFSKKNHFTLVFIHGLGSDHTCWNSYIQHFRKKCGIVAVDLRGYGKSDKSAKKENYQLQNFADDLSQLIRKLQLKKYYLIGYSLGGIIVLESMVKDRVHPKGMVLMGTPRDFTDVTKSFIFQIQLSRIFPQWLFKLLDTSQSYADTKNAFLFKIKCLARNNLKNSLFILDNLKDYSFTGRIKFPCLEIFANHDEIIENRMREVCDDVKFIPGNHLTFLFHPEKVYPLIERFIEKK